MTSVQEVECCCPWSINSSGIGQGTLGSTFVSILGQDSEPQIAPADIVLACE